MIPRFVPRPEYMEALRQYLLPDLPPRRKTAILHGLGGIGKTQLAIKFARDHQQEFSSVFFLVERTQRDDTANPGPRADIPMEQMAISPVQ